MIRLGQAFTMLSLCLLPLVGLAANEAGVLPQWLGFMADADVAYLVFLLALLGLLVEIASPGLTLPGLLGATGIVVSLYALQLLGANMWAVLVMSVGLVLIILPLFKPSWSALAWLGVAVFGLGSYLFLLAPDLTVSLPVMVGLTLASGWFYLWVVSRFGRLRHTHGVSGHDALIGKSALVVDGFPGEGRVEVNGTYWSASSTQALPAGAKVEVIAIDGLTLSVRSFQE